MRSYQVDMCNGPIFKKLIIFSLPLILSGCLQLLFNAADIIVVGRFTGNQALAAVGSTSALINLLVNMFIGISVGANVVLGKSIGARDEENTSKAVHTAIFIAVFGGLLMVFVGFFFAKPLLELMATPEDVIDLSSLYMRIYFAGMPFFMVYNFGAAILRSIGDTKRPLYFLLISGIINVLFNLCFVIVFDMGVAGVALATIISQYISAGLCLYLLFTTKGTHRIVPSEVKIHKELLGEILKYGLPSGFQNSIIGLANVVVQSNINSFGDMAMAGCGAYSKIEGFAFLPITSFTMALTTFVGQNLGARQYDRVLKGAKFGMICSMTLAEIIGVIIFVFSPQFVAAFDATPEVIHFGTLRGQTSAFFFCLLAYSHCVSAILRGAGKSMIPMIVMMVCWCFVRVTGLTIMGALVHNIWCVYWIYPITWSLSSITFFIYYHRVDWLHA